MAFTTIEERLAAVERLLGLTDGAVPYTSNYSGDQIDEAVGRALPGGALDTGKAPAGFGLGGNAKTLTASDDLNNITACGWYTWDTRPANCPDDIANGQMLVLNGVYGLVTQVIFQTKGTVAQRSCYYGTWRPWEWRDPPMELGIEYRTTDRYNGKPVYAKLVDCGYGPNSTSKSILHNIADYGMTVSAFGTVVSNGGKWEVHDVSSSTIRSIGATKEAVFLFSSTDQTSNKVYVLLKYTKTTD